MRPHTDTHDRDLGHPIVAQYFTAF
jgi:hypothetical protein